MFYGAANENGDAVFSFTGHMVIYSNGKFKVPAERPRGVPTGMNATGEISAFHNDPSRFPGHWTIPFRANVKEYRVLSHLGTGTIAETSGINDTGDVVGWSHSWSAVVDGIYRGESKAVVWRSEKPQVLQPPPGVSVTDSRALAINRGGVIVGSMSFDGKRRAFRFRGSVMEELPIPAEYISSVATDINDRGDIIGNVFTGPGDSHAFLLKEGKFSILVPNAFTSAVAINNRGHVVVATVVSQGSWKGGFLIQNGTAHPIGLLGSGEIGDQLEGKAVGAIDITPVDINDAGMIVATAVREGPTLAFLLTPLETTNRIDAAMSVAVKGRESRTVRHRKARVAGTATKPAVALSFKFGDKRGFVPVKEGRWMLPLTIRKKERRKLVVQALGPTGGTSLRREVRILRR